MKKLLRLTAGLVLSVAALVFSSTSAFALPVSGSFQLTDDGTPGTDVIATGNFVTGSTVTAVNDTSGALLYNAVDLVSFNVTDVDGDFADYSIVDFAGGIVGVLGTGAIDSVVGFVGIGNTGTVPGSQIDFVAPDAGSTGPQAVNFTSFDGNGTMITITAFASGVQLVSEPNILALMGIALVGVGFARRRVSS